MSERVHMNFGKALGLLKSSEFSGQYKVTRDNWYGSQASPKVCLQIPDENSKMTEPYLYMEKNAPDGSKVVFPLDLSCESILADDWVAVE